MSRGSLKIPSNNLFRAVKIFEKHFREIYKEKLSNEPNIFQKLSNIHNTTYFKFTNSRSSSMYYSNSNIHKTKQPQQENYRFTI
ncbi:Uncharacterized protein FWK35_00009933 [Aphis craccivora]|uniref:Uncharacterized protein n=1 Tax=Aphis craccivora TaxID=307492 RepID=A0A6G0YSB7_APHCR|nr:Uncharacterized protein FWK35_00009933 [Aphis craccivora]